jgi:nitroimidazol reductase NimA-like FMN-containing flavoprotein (pyridoxamine 5'-phosphate oxidase superfamily)
MRGRAAPYGSILGQRPGAIAKEGEDVSFPVTDRTRVRRHPERGDYRRETVYAILDEALYCHVGFVRDGQPCVLPTIHVRVGDALYLHGANASAMLGALADGAPACVTVTLLDGLVLARSVYHHSMNYRSAVVYGTLAEVTDPEEKRGALQALVEHVVPGRSADARPPSEQELQATRVLRLPIREASAKVRSGPPKDAEADMALPVWAGIVPLALQALPPVPDPSRTHELPLPSYLEADQRFRPKG